jgi:hypothetical protein
MEELQKFDFVCSGRHGNRHHVKVVLTLRDTSKVRRWKPKGKPIRTTPLDPESALRYSSLHSEFLDKFQPLYVALTPAENCYWINDEPPTKWGNPSKPHAQLVCPLCGLTKRLSETQAARILETLKDKGTFDIQKAR